MHGPQIGSFTVHFPNKNLRRNELGVFPNYGFARRDYKIGAYM